jgi:hypothetical protein
MSKVILFFTSRKDLTDKLKPNAAIRTPVSFNKFDYEHYHETQEQMSKASVQSTLLYVQFYNCVKK